MTIESNTNWIERRALHDRKRREGAGAVWIDVSQAISDCCKSFNTHYSRLTTVEVRKRGQEEFVQVKHLDPIPAGAERVVSIKFDGDQITVLAGEDKLKSFEIAADDTHAYLSHDGREISPDEFSQLVLEGVLFPKPRPAIQADF